MPRAAARFRFFATFQSLKSTRTANALNEKDFRSDASWQTALERWVELDEQNAGEVVVGERTQVRLDAVLRLRRDPDAVTTLSPLMRVTLVDQGVTRVFQVLAPVRSGPREIEVFVREVLS